MAAYGCFLPDLTRFTTCRRPGRDVKARCTLQYTAAYDADPGCGVRTSSILRSSTSMSTGLVM